MKFEDRLLDQKNNHLKCGYFSVRQTELKVMFLGQLFALSTLVMLLDLV